MSASRIFLVAGSMLLSGAAFAQQPTETAPAPDAAAAPRNCAAQPARHDHGAERGTPTSMPRMAGCAMNEMSGMGAATEAAADAKPKVKPGHDHARMHKLM